MDKMRQNKEEIVSCGRNLERIQKAICAGLALNAAKKHSERIVLGLRNADQQYSLVQNSNKVFTIHLASGFAKKTNIEW